MASQIVILGALFLLTSLCFYLFRINHLMNTTPPEAIKLSPRRWTTAEIREAYNAVPKTAAGVTKYLPPKTNRRYIVVGGSGLVGGWIVEHLLQRGENASHIRILDIQQPKRPSIVKNKVTYITTDIADESAVHKAFNTPWNPESETMPLTVFHTAAFIKPYDRKYDFLTPYIKINVQGTQNVLSAAKKAGCSIFIATSSGSIGVRRPVYFVPPWRQAPENWLRISHNGDPEHSDDPLDKYSGCYAYSKATAEALVTRADNKSDGFRTGAIRPGHAIYGHGDENVMSVAYDYLRRGGSPTWISHIVTQLVSAANISLAHLLFEAKLAAPSAHLDIGGNAYAITDPTPPITYQDLYTTLGTLAHHATPCNFPRVAPVPILLLSYLVESYCVLRHRCLPFLPAITGDLKNIQPALFNVCTMHMVYDISRAKEELGYETEFGTMDGLCLQVREWNDKVNAALQGGKQPTGITKPIKGSSVT